MVLMKMTIFCLFQVTDARKVEKRVNVRLNDLLRNKYVKETWEGSPIDLTASLTLQFAYYFAGESERLRNLKRCFAALSNILSKHSQRQLTVRFIFEICLLRAL